MRSYSTNLTKVWLTFISFVLLIFLKAETANAACWCANPDQDNCRCGRTGTSPYSATWQGVQLYCDTAAETTSEFTLVAPICGSSPEIIPACAPAQDNPTFFVCYGGNFAQGQSNIPPDGSGGLDGPIVWNGVSYGGTQPLTYYSCGANNFCCASNICDSTNAPPLPTYCEPQRPWVTPPEEICGNVPPQTGGEGESRLWFSQIRLVAALATMTQTLFNPYQLNHLYQESAFSKNAPASDPSGRIDNPGALTTRIERHQGIDDPTIVVNTEDNNSSVIVGQPAPPPLYPFGNTSDENIYNDNLACYIPEVRNNPGDDLIGPKIVSEMLFTQRFEYQVPPQYEGCLPEGATYTRDPVTEPCNETCCSAVCNPASNPCISIGGSGTCPPLGNTTHVYLCSSEPGVNFCCPNSTTQCVLEAGTCGSLPPVNLPAGGEAVVFDKTPLIEHIYDVVLNGKDSIFKRFMPYVPELKFTEIPTSSLFGASVASRSPNATSAVDVKFAQGHLSSPTLYFPHVGTLYKYWLQDFQFALRPQGSASSDGNPDVPPPGGYGTCEENQGQYCNSQFLEDQTCFDTPVTASNASQICNLESGGNPDRVNDACTYTTDNINNDVTPGNDDGPGCVDENDTPQNGCTQPYYDGATYDYSVGLFQINLLAGRCPEAFGFTQWQPYPVCEIVDEIALQECVEEFQDPINNIEFACGLSNNGQNFSDAWVAASQQCGIP